MASKTANKMLDALKNEILGLVEAVGHVNSCKSRLEDLMTKMSDPKTDGSKWNKLASDYNKCFAELDRVWKRWPNKADSAHKQAANVKAYCASKRKVHKHLPFVRKSIDEISGKVDDAMKDFEHCISVLNSFGDFYKKAKGNAAPTV